MDASSRRGREKLDSPAQQPLPRRQRAACRAPAARGTASCSPVTCHLCLTGGVFQPEHPSPAAAGGATSGLTRVDSFSYSLSFPVNVL